MKIEVWRKGKLTRGNLSAFAYEGRVFAHLRVFKAPMNTRQRIPLSDELANEVLGTERRPCPYVGDMPRRGYYSEGYYYNRRDGIGGTTNISRHCMSCGYSDVREYVPILTHPVTNYLVTSKYRRSFTDAGWDDARGVLTPDDSDDRLILWMKPSQTRSSESAATKLLAADERLADATFPNANIIGDKAWLRLLQQPQHAPAGEPVRTH